MSKQKQHQQEDTRADRRRRYYRVLRCVEHNTGGRQAGAVRRASVAGILVHDGPLTLKQFHNVIAAARRNSDLAQLRDPRDSTKRLVRNTEADLIELIEWLGELDTDASDIIADITVALRELRADD